MLADLLLLESLASTLAGTLILVLSSRTGSPLWVAIALLSLAFLTGCFLLASVKMSKKSTNRRAQMVLAAQRYKILTAVDASEKTD